MKNQMNIFDEVAQRLENKRAQQQAQERQRVELVEAIKNILTDHEHQRALELWAAAKELFEELSKSKLLKGRKDAQVTIDRQHREKVVLTVGPRRLTIEVRYPPSDRTYFIRNDGGPTALAGAGKMTEAVVEFLCQP